MDVWSLERYAPHEVRRSSANSTPTGAIPRRNGADPRTGFRQYAAVQKGGKSRAFEGSLTNPLQEAVVTHLYRSIRQFINEGPRGGQLPAAEAGRARRRIIEGGPPLRRNEARGARMPRRISLGVPDG